MEEIKNLKCKKKKNNGLIRERKKKKKLRLKEKYMHSFDKKKENINKKAQN